MYPQRPALLVPTFIGAFVGSDDRLPEWQHAFKDPRAAQATELMVRLLRERTAFEANLFEENNGFLVAASVFPYFYALMGERNPKLAPKAGARSPYSALACDAFEVIQREGAISKQKLAGELGGESPRRARQSISRVVDQAAHHARRLPGERGIGMGPALPLGPGAGERGRRPVGSRGALRAGLEVSGLRHRGGAEGVGNLFRKFRRALEGQRSGERAAGRTRVELRACERKIDAADHARRKSCLYHHLAQRRADAVGFLSARARVHFNFLSRTPRAIAHGPSAPRTRAHLLDCGSALR